MDPSDIEQALLAATQASSLDEVNRILTKNKALNVDESVTVVVKQNNEAILEALLAAKAAQGTAIKVEILGEAARAKSSTSIIKMLMDTASEEDLVKLLFEGIDSSIEYDHLSMLEYLWEMATVQHLSYFDFNRAAGGTLLHWAAQHGSINAARFLVDCGANVNEVDDSNGTALMAAAICTDISLSKQVAEFLIESGASLEVFETTNLHDKCTALMIASECGNYEVVPALLAAGAEVDAAFPGVERTALHYAMGGETKGSHVCARLLIAAGADVTARDVSGSTPLHFAHDLPPSWFSKKVFGESYLALYDDLIKHGADINAVNDFEINSFEGIIASLPFLLNLWYLKEGDYPWANALFNRLLRDGADMGPSVTYMHSLVLNVSSIVGYNGHWDVEAAAKQCSYMPPGVDWRLAISIGGAIMVKKLLKAGVKADAKSDAGTTALGRVFASVPIVNLVKYKEHLAPMVMALIEGGDYHSFERIPVGIPGLGKCLKLVWEKAPEELPNVFAKLSADDQERVKVVLKCLNRNKINQDELKMQILSETFKVNYMPPGYSEDILDAV